MNPEKRPDFLRVIQGGKAEKRELANPPLETPEAIENIGAVSNEAIAQTLAEQDLVFEGKREQISAGIFGPIYLVEAKDKDGNVVRILEKAFSTNRKAEGKRYTKYIAGISPYTGKQIETRPRLGVVAENSPELSHIVVDWLYNEEQALRDLDGIPGIPKSYGAAYEGLEGSILEQFVDGYDLNFCAANVMNEDEINSLVDKIEKTYKAAARKGYVFSEPNGGTIMVDRASKIPYLIDWYNHSKGSIESEGPIQDLYLEGLKKIAVLRQSLLIQYREEQKAAG